MKGIQLKDHQISFYCGICNKPITDLRHGIAFWSDNNQSEIEFAHDYCEETGTCFKDTVFESWPWVRLDFLVKEVFYQMILTRQSSVPVKQLAMNRSYIDDYKSEILNGGNHELRQ